MEVLLVVHKVVQNEVLIRLLLGKVPMCLKSEWSMRPFDKNLSAGRQVYINKDNRMQNKRDFIFVFIRHVWYKHFGRMILGSWEVIDTMFRSKGLLLSYLLVHGPWCHLTVSENFLWVVYRFHHLEVQSEERRPWRLDERDLTPGPGWTSRLQISCLRKVDLFFISFRRGFNISTQICIHRESSYGY